MRYFVSYVSKDLFTEKLHVKNTEIEVEKEINSKQDIKEIERKLRRGVFDLITIINYIKLQDE